METFMFSLSSKCLQGLLMSSIRTIFNKKDLILKSIPIALLHKLFTSKTCNCSFIANEQCMIPMGKRL